MCSVAQRSFALSFFSQSLGRPILYVRDRGR